MEMGLETRNDYMLTWENAQDRFYLLGPAADSKLEFEFVGALLSADEILALKGKSVRNLAMDRIDQLLEQCVLREEMPVTRADSASWLEDGAEVVPVVPKRRAPVSDSGSDDSSDSSDTSDSSSDMNDDGDSALEQNKLRWQKSNGGAKHMQKKAKVGEENGSSSLQSLKSPRARPKARARTTTTTTPKPAGGTTTPAKRGTPAKRVQRGSPVKRATAPAAPVAAPLEVRHDTKGSVCGLALSPDGLVFASAVKKFVYLWSTGEQGDYKAYWEGERKVACLTFVPRTAAVVLADPGYVLAIGSSLVVTLVHCSPTSPFRVLSRFESKGGH
jgi:hypothetical protein